MCFIMHQIQNFHIRGNIVLDLKQACNIIIFRVNINNSKKIDINNTKNIMKVIEEYNFVFN